MKTTESATTSLEAQFGTLSTASEVNRDGIATFWVPREQVHRILLFLKEQISSPYRMLYDLTAIDERMRLHRSGELQNDFTAVYHLFSFERNEYIRIKTALEESALSIDSVTDLWPSANWYEREVWDMFGIHFDGHPHLRRILMPPWWQGHPLRKEHPARATETGVFQLPDDQAETEEDALRFRPEEWGLTRK